MHPSKEYFQSLTKIRELVDAYQKDGTCKATTDELNQIVELLEPIDFAAYGKEICALYNSKISGPQKVQLNSINLTNKRNSNSTKISFIDRNDGTSKYYPKYPEFLPTVLYPVQ